MDLLSELKKLTSRLTEDGIEYALCGGLAMAVYAMPRATLDIDLLIEGGSLARTMNAAQDLGYTFVSLPMVLQEGKVVIHRVTRIDPATKESLVLDLLLVTTETSKAWEGRRRIEWEDGMLSVVSPEGLILLKSFRSNGQDLEDIRYLRSIRHED